MFSRKTRAPLENLGSPSRKRERERDDVDGLLGVEQAASGQIILGHKEQRTLGIRVKVSITSPRRGIAVEKWTRRKVKIELRCESSDSRSSKFFQVSDGSALLSRYAAPLLIVGAERPGPAHALDLI